MITFSVSRDHAKSGKSGEFAQDAPPGRRANERHRWAVLARIRVSYTKRRRRLASRRTVCLSARWRGIAKLCGPCQRSLVLATIHLSRRFTTNAAAPRRACSINWYKKTSRRSSLKWRRGRTAGCQNLSKRSLMPSSSAGSWRMVLCERVVAVVCTKSSLPSAVNAVDFVRLAVRVEWPRMRRGRWYLS